MPQPNQSYATRTVTPAARLRSEQFDEPAAHGVAVDDVHLDVNRVAGGGDRLFPRRVVLGRVAEDADVVARDERRARGAAEGLVGQRAHRGPFAGEVSAANRRTCGHG